MKSVLIAACLSVAVQRVAAWGFLGHQTIGYVAQQFLAPNALAFVQSSLQTDFQGSLGLAATWADTVRSQQAYSWSSPYHFVDALDAPLQGQCSVDENRDCGTGKCILLAIANYTSRVVDTSLDSVQRGEALKFLDHFLGDIGQPLHVEATAFGGNDIPATCAGSSTNLHAAWDTGMVVRNINLNHGGTSLQYASDLIVQIQTGSFKSLTASWLTCTSTTAPLSGGVPVNGITPLQCPIVWATESNSYDCSAVFNFVTGQDLCTSSYFTTAVPIIDLQLAKQGYRLAAWLNVLFDGSPHLS